MLSRYSAALGSLSRYASAGLYCSFSRYVPAFQAAVQDTQLHSAAIKIEDADELPCFA
jgi:hypothetical protein